MGNFAVQTAIAAARGSAVVHYIIVLHMDVGMNVCRIKIAQTTPFVVSKVIVLIKTAAELLVLVNLANLTKIVAELACVVILIIYVQKIAVVKRSDS